MIKQLTQKLDLQRVVQQWRDDGLIVGYVPTMGALHDGHLSLVKQALQYADRVVVSIFVNPTQFAPTEDLETYPRDEDGDIQQLNTIGVHAVYTPTIETMYPNGMDTAIKPGPAANGLETAFRPHFFGGVVNIVSRLFDHVQPDLAIFGEKDFQQLQVIKEMVVHQIPKLKIIGAPIVRDEHGLALSSRNAYLSTDELVVARTLNRILYEAAQDFTKPENTEDQVLKGATQALIDAGFDKVDYVAHRWDRVLAAVWLGRTRLIDNVGVQLFE